MEEFLKSTLAADAEKFGGVVGRLGQQHVVDHGPVLDAEQVADEVVALLEAAAGERAGHAARGRAVEAVLGPLPQTVPRGGRRRMVLVVAVHLGRGGGAAHARVLLAVPQHAVLERELAPANVAREGPLAGVRAHVAPQVFGRPEAAHAERAHHLRAHKGKFFFNFLCSNSFGIINIPEFDRFKTG
jgi:hypothetical protein